MKQMPCLISMLATVTLLAGCDQLSGKFEIVHAGNQTLLLNTSTGDAQLIDGVSLVKIKAPEVVTTDLNSKQAKIWPAQEIPQLSNLKLGVRTKFRDGQMLYLIEATPYKGRLEKEFTGAGSDNSRQPIIFLDLYDEDGFSVGGSIELKIRDGGATRVVNEKGEPYALSWTGSRPMTLEAYRASTTQSVRWGGFSKE